MTALWIAFACLTAFMLLLFAGLVLLVFHLAVVITALRNHTHDTDVHWNSKWGEDDHA